MDQRAHWSPSSKKVWCIDCTNGRSSVPNTAPAHAARGAVNVANPAKVSITPSAADSPQAAWEQLCEYAQRCIEADAAKSLVPYAMADSSWFLHPGEETLVIGHHDSVQAPAKLAAKLSSTAGQQDNRSIIYGWPTVVVIDRDHVPKVAPLFVVQINTEQYGVDGWELHATAEAEFNLAITASGVFDPSVTEEISDLLGDTLPFDDADSLATLALGVADLLGLRINSPLDPSALAPHIDRKQGVYNAAISVITEVSAFTVTLREELRQLKSRSDWGSTAAGHLIHDGFNPGKLKSSSSGPLAAPLASNQSQEEALARIRREPLTIVTGPPGTGKTQLVVNAITNAWLDGDKVLVTSTNNSAVNVAVDRAERDVCAGLLVRTGNRAIRDQVPDRIALASANAEEYEGNQASARAHLKLTADERARMMTILARSSELDGELLAVAEDLAEARPALVAATQTLWGSDQSPKLSFGPLEIERRARRLSQTWFFPRWRTKRFREQLGFSECASLDQLFTWARIDQRVSKLTSRLSAGRVEHKQIEVAIGDPMATVRELDRKWEGASLGAIRADAAARIRSGARRLAVFGRASAGGEPFKRAISNSLEYLQGWACTTLSTSPNFLLEPGLFDLVIVDEASQCSLAAVLPLAYRAKRLVVVGDPCQLNPIVPIGDRQLQEIAAQCRFDRDDLRRRGIDHKNGSSYLAFEFAAKSQGPVLLNEHYRCHPHIARWFNRAFYKNELSILTEVAEMSRRDRSIFWQDVEGTAERPANGSSWLNLVEAERAVERLADILPSVPSVGVVTPFVAQARLIQQLAEERIGSAILSDANFVCGTAHRLQGDERDAIIFSTVLSPNVSTSSVNWIEKEKNLLNVAVSRARRSLIVLGHPSIGSFGSPTLASLRAYLQDEIGSKRADSRTHAEFRTDSRPEEFLLSAMQLRGLIPYAKLEVEGYELDFALLEQGIKLNVEVDGDQHLDARGRTRRQDITRDRILYDLGWTVLRVPAWRCYEDIESVLGEIETARHQILDGGRVATGSPATRAY